VSSPRVVLVTGASSGIGRAAAVLAARAGDHVALLARGEGPLKEVADVCDREGAASTTVLAADVGDDEAVRTAVAALLDRHGRIDGVIHAAGVVAYGRTEQVPPEVFERVVRTNLLGSVHLVRHVLPGMRERDAGTYVQIGSLLGQIAVPTMSPYVVSKWGVRALLRQLEIENRDRPGVRFCHVSPGGVDTPIYWQAGTYDGFVGRPPPPVVSPEHVARHALRLLDHPRKRTQVPFTNELIRFGYTFLPGVYDVLVRQLFPVAGKDLTAAVPPGAGNVLDSSPDGNQLKGNQGNAAVGIARNLLSLVRGGGAPR
jgi:NAD(P)-dependent dehydrogenase (short-subunit alcohol dehydrogenase family)